MCSLTLRIDAMILSVVALFVLLSLSATPSHAQTALCPGSIAGQTGFALSNGTCTNGFTGAFSGAALATQSLSDLSQSATQETVRNTSSAIATRREEELQRCPDGFSRVSGTCERIKPVAAPAVSRPVVTPVAPARSAAKPVAAARLARRVIAPPRPVLVETVTPPLVLDPAPIYQSRFGAWAQGFGSTEDRSALGHTSINCCTALPGVAAGIPIGLTINEKSHSDTYGFLGGIDYTARSLNRADDGLILGVLAGYLESDFRIKTATTSSLLPNVGNGSSTVHATLSGASTGVYATYFSGPFTADLAFKADIFDLNESFTDQLAFTINVDGAGNLVAPGVNAFSGNGSGGLTNLSTFGNLTYRLGTYGPIWLEPVVGFQYTASLYDNRAKRELGLDDGDLLMVQGGARIGTDTILANQRKLSTSLTGLAYSDVSVSGGFIEGGFFGTNLLAKSDEGQVRGRGVLAVNYDLGSGVNLYAQGDVYGGDRLFGAGGKGGVRVQW